ncbi:adenylyl-sulfate kinase 3-like [Primulina eburnea]|uniref:adenylyl-sulfate kinase 3-like n=1 Tax=Primulina eburnea TaxID=1245227 RepID=UPI003C6BFBE9
MLKVEKMTAVNCQKLNLGKMGDLNSPEALYTRLTPVKVAVCNGKGKKLGIYKAAGRSSLLAPIKAMEASKPMTYANGQAKGVERDSAGDVLTKDCSGFTDKSTLEMSTIGNSSNIVWHNCPVSKIDRQHLLNQKGCVIWITGLSGSGKSTLACALSRSLHSRGKLSYILDGDNCRHGLNRDLSFKAEDRAENIRRIGEVAKLFVDAGVISIASLISPFRKDRDACRALLPEGDFIEVYMDVPVQVCENRDPKGLYKLARAGKIKGFTGVDDPYEPPLNAEIVLQQSEEKCDSPTVLAEVIVSFLERKVKAHS